MHFKSLLKASLLSSKQVAIEVVLAIVSVLHQLNSDSTVSPLLEQDLMVVLTQLIATVAVDVSAT